MYEMRVTIAAQVCLLLLNLPVSYYDRLRSETALGIPDLFGPYAVTQPAEFFAVVTELFFERPHELREQHPALFDEFRQYYRQDPDSRFF